MASIVGTGAGPVYPLPAVAGADLTGKEGYLVKNNGTASPPTMILATATSEAGISILLTAGTSGSAITYAGPGSRVAAKAGGTCSAGVRAMFATGGKVTDATGNVQTVGIFVEDGVDGDLVLLDVSPMPVGTSE